MYLEEMEYGRKMYLMEYERNMEYSINGEREELECRRKMHLMECERKMEDGRKMRGA
jgi:hypothetical protein